jgi:hypothetical protein
MEWEVQAYGTPFTGADVSTGPLTDTGAPDGAAGSWVALAGLADGLTAATQYCWRVRFASDNPYFPRSPWVGAAHNGATEADLRTPGGAVGVPGADRSLATLRLTNAPNPFNPQTTFSYALAVRGPVRLAIYDAQGREIARLVDEIQAAGEHLAAWDARDARGSSPAPGVYFARLEAASRERVRKVVLMK